MKELLFILIAFVLISSCSQTEKKIEKTDSEKYGLRGKVKSVCISNYKAKENFGIDVLKDGKPQNSYDLLKFGEDSCYRFDESGHFIEREWLPYDENGQYLKDLSRTDISLYKIIRTKNIYINNILTKKIETFSNNRVMINDYVYRSDGLIDSIKLCSREPGVNIGCSNGTIYTKYKYDVNGFIASETHVNNGRIMSNNIYTCDARGNITKDKEYGTNMRSNVEGDLTSTKNFEYDELNRVISEKTISNPESSYYQYRYEYNKNNKLVLKEYGLPTSIYFETYRYVYDYNDDLIITIISTTKGLGKETFEYTYDKINNWIKKIGYTNDKPVTITERTIEYF